MLAYLAICDVNLSIEVIVLIVVSCSTAFYLCYRYSSIVFARYTIIDHKSSCSDICRELMNESIVSIDLEGVNLGRTGKICLLQLACMDGRVFLFDIYALGEDAFIGDFSLRTILESESIIKLMYDCRSDCDALFHQYRVLPVRIFDLQVLYVLMRQPRSKYLPGLKQVLTDTLIGSTKLRVDRIKAEGHQLFAPTQGGNFEVWKERPLQRKLLEYAAEDVKQLFAVYDKYRVDNAEDSALMKRIFKKSKLRMKSTIRRKEEWPRGYKSPWAKRDF
jgi:ribonuclease D